MAAQPSRAFSLCLHDSGCWWCSGTQLKRSSHRKIFFSPSIPVYSAHVCLVLGTLKNCSTYLFVLCSPPTPATERVWPSVLRQGWTDAQKGAKYFPYVMSLPRHKLHARHHRKGFKTINSIFNCQPSYNKCKKLVYSQSLLRRWMQWFRGEACPQDVHALKAWSSAGGSFRRCPGHECASFTNGLFFHEFLLME